MYISIWCVLACNRPPFTVQYTVSCNVVNRLLECVSTKSIQSLNNEGLRYDNITLIRQSRKQLARIIVRLVEIENNYTGQTTNQARGTTMKNLWKRQPRKSCQFKALVTKRMTCFYLMCRFLEVRGT